ncbi:hypothetical protein D046_2989A, partial [Vibrio parahaemolyticus V-223/04]
MSGRQDITIADVTGTAIGAIAVTTYNLCIELPFSWIGGNAAHDFRL